VAFQNSSAGQSLTVGFAFINQNPGSSEHLWIVVALSANDEAVMFNVTTVRAGCDLTCPVNVGDHPFVKHDSVIAYGRGQIITPTIFEALQRAGCTIQPSASADLVKRIREGPMKSRFTSQKLQVAIAASIA